MDGKECHSAGATLVTAQLLALLHVQALFVPTVLAGYASMVTHHILDPAVLVAHASDAQLPAQVPPLSFTSVI